MSVLFLTADLATSSKVTGAAARQGVPLTVAMNADRLCELAEATPPRMVLLDLTFTGVSPAELVPRLRALPRPPLSIVAFGPHCHEARLAEAVEAGCDAVMSRGQFYAQVDQVLGSTRNAAES